MNRYAVEINNLSKSYNLSKDELVKGRSKLRTRKIIDNISFSLEKGRTMGIVGNNGSGKTTLLRLIAGILTPNEGKIVVNGKIGPLLQIGAGSNEELSVKENIILQGILLGIEKRVIIDKISEILKFAELEEHVNTKMKHLSSGMKVRIMFSTAISMDPDILLVDEVISVGDISFRQKSFDAFLSFKKQNKTIIFVSHNLTQIQQICDEVIMLDKGKIIEMGKPEKVIKTYQDFCNKKQN
jgi:ABC-type polysaccharide/polyol phosphate transport system ATPase subunit